MTVVLDLYSIRDVGWSFLVQPINELSIHELQLAVHHCQPEQPLLFYLDQGVQCSNDGFQLSLSTDVITATLSS